MNMNLRGQMVNLCLFQYETVKRPAVKVRLLPRPAVENYLKEEVFDFFLIDPHPVNVAFATYAAVKRMVGLSTKNSFTWNFAPSTPLIRRFIGFKPTTSPPTGTKEVVKFSASHADGWCRCPRSWDSPLGDRWDLLPGQGAVLDTVIRCLKFTEHRDFGLFTLRCHINTSRDHYRNEQDYG